MTGTSLVLLVSFDHQLERVPTGAGRRLFWHGWLLARWSRTWAESVCRVAASRVETTLGAYLAALGACMRNCVEKVLLTP